MRSGGLVDVTTGGEIENPVIILGSDKNTCSKTHINGTKSILAPAETSSSSYLSKSSSNDFFQVETAKFTKCMASKSASTDEQSGISSKSSVKSEVDNSCPVPTSTSQIYIVTHDNMGMSPTLCPPVQVMDRSSEYDPCRIPSSVFGSNTNPMEWSIGSNESLFSIQIGNHSFNADRVFTSKELGKSGDLTKSGELMFSPLASVLIEETDSGRKSVEMEDSQTTEMSDEVFKLEERLSKNHYEVKNSHPAVSYGLSMVSSHSLGIQTSANSSAPIKKCTWPFCYFSICSWTFCHYMRLSCCCLSCPSCSCLNCSWALCCCWTCRCCSCNCSHKRFCCRASLALAEMETLSSEKTDSPGQQSKNNASEVISSSSSYCCNWFQCFSWSCCTWRKCCEWGKCCGSGKCCPWGKCCGWRKCCRWGKCCGWRKCCGWGNCCQWGKCCGWGKCCQWGNCCQWGKCCGWGNCSRSSCCCC